MFEQRLRKLRTDIDILITDYTKACYPNFDKLSHEMGIDVVYLQVGYEAQKANISPNDIMKIIDLLKGTSCQMHKDK